MVFPPWSVTLFLSPTTLVVGWLCWLGMFSLLAQFFLLLSPLVGDFVVVLPFLVVGSSSLLVIGVCFGAFVSFVGYDG